MRLPTRRAKRLVAVEQRAATSEIDLIFKKYRGMKALRMAREAVKPGALAEAMREEKARRMAMEAENKDRSPET